MQSKTQGWFSNVTRPLNGFCLWSTQRLGDTSNGHGLHTSISGSGSNGQFQRSLSEPLGCFFPEKKGEEGRKVLHSTGMYQWYQLILVGLLLFVHKINIIMFKRLIFDIIWSWLTSCDLSTIFSEFLATKKDSHVSKPLTDWLVVTPFFSENPKGNRIYRLGNLPNSKPISCWSNWSTHIKMQTGLIDWLTLRCWHHRIRYFDRNTWGYSNVFLGGETSASGFFYGNWFVSM